MMISAEIINWNEFRNIIEIGRKNNIPIQLEDGSLNPILFKDFHWEYKMILLEGNA